MPRAGPLPTRPQFACRVLLRLGFLRSRRRSSHVKTDVHYPPLNYPVHRAIFESQRERDFPALRYLLGALSLLKRLSLLTDATLLTFPQQKQMLWNIM